MSGFTTATYVAKPGDWLAKIAEEHGTTVGAIWNHPQNAAHRARRVSPDKLSPGDVLIIPVAQSAPPVEPPAIPPPEQPPPAVPPPGTVRPTAKRWPYPPTLPKNDELPTWDCPGGLCVCHPTSGDVERVAHTLVLHDETATRMPRGRCRVYENGLLLERELEASSVGTVALQLLSTSRSVWVEWAPAEMPERSPYPFCKRYNVVHDGSRKDSDVATRLSNIGFAAHRSERENILAFQDAYGLSTTGRPADVRLVVGTFNDGAALPPLPPATGASQPASDQSSPRSSLVEGDSSAPPVAPPATSTKLPPNPTQGVVSGIQTTQLTIVLQTTFALFKADVEQFDEPWHDTPPSDKGEHQNGTYDAHRLLDTFYPGTARQNSPIRRFGGKFVRGATITASQAAGPSLDTQKTSATGRATFNLLPLRGSGVSVLTFTVSPPKGQLNPTGLPAGPQLTDKNTTAPFLFRPFTIVVTFNATGAAVLDETIIMPDTRPRFAKTIGTTARTTGSTLLVDWRPDWMRAKASNPGRILDPQDTPLNPFDKSADQNAILGSAPPAIVIHQTATKNFNAIGSHLIAKHAVGCHYWVDFDGFAVKLVDEFFKANHCGDSLWLQRGSVNQFSVGIETMHMDTVTPQSEKNPKPASAVRRFLREQYDTHIRLCRELQAEYPILKRHVLGHTDPIVRSAAGKRPGSPASISDATSKHRGCPGDYYDWEILEKAQVALHGFFFVNPPKFGPFVGFHAVLGDFLLRTTSVPALTAGKATSSPEVLFLKQLLFDVGYSVSRRRSTRAQLTEVFDTPFAEAIRAFQLRHFSGQRRRYRNFGAIGVERSFPHLRTVDSPTIRAIVEVWWAASQG